MSKNIKLDDLFKFWGSPFVMMMYQICFNREPDTEELIYYVNKLNNGVERIKVIEHITELEDSLITLADIKGATKLRNKVDYRQLMRKKLKPIKPLYLLVTEYEKRRANERIILNNGYELRFLLNDISIAAVKSEAIDSYTDSPGNLSQVGVGKEFIQSLSHQEAAAFKSLMQQLKP